jgi:cyanate permease
MVVLVAAGAGYGGGNIGPATTAVSREFGISLSTVGLTMTVFFAAITFVTLGAAPIAHRLGPRVSIVLCCVLAGVGNVICAVSPWFAGVLVGRAVVGLGAGLVFVIVPVVARANGGARLVGLFGAAVTIGVAVALGIGSVLADAGVSWRIGFAISAVVGASALVALPRQVTGGAQPARRNSGFLGRALREPAVWRLVILFIGTNGIGLVISTWLIQYLVGHGGDALWLAGVLGFVLFAETALLRQVSGRLAESGPTQQRLAAVSPLVSALGLAGLAFDAGSLPSLLWVLMMGVGFALPYAVVIERAQRLFPESAAEVMAVIQTGPNVVPMVVIPVVGSALDSGHGPAAMAALAAFMAIAALLNAGRGGATGSRSADRRDTRTAAPSATT